jgi:hypothetical protein
MIKTVYKSYFQKSRIFLYPVLGIKQDVVTPYQTYVGWKDHIEPSDKLLIVSYKTLAKGFPAFEKTLLKHPQLQDFYQLDTEGLGAYIFYLEEFPDWDNFLNGNYSKFSDKTKSRILGQYGTSAANTEYLKSYLYPENYYKDYADALGVDESVLKSVGELCSKPDMNKEILKATQKELDLSKLIN